MVPSDPSHTPEEDTLGNLMALAQQGDESAYAELLNEVATILKRYCRKFIFDEGSLEDCVQECLVAIHKARATYDPKRLFKPWMYTIARNKTIDFLRASSRVKAEEVSDELIETKQDIRDFSYKVHLSDQLSDALGKLKPGYRDSIILTKYAGYSVEEAADILSISPVSLRVRVSRGLEKLREILGDF